MGENPSKRRSRKERRAIISEYRESGLSQQEFCTREGLNLSTFKYWLQDRGEGSSFSKLSVSTPPAECSIELSMPNGIVLRIRGQ
jgi:transposase-like protein